MMGVMAVVAEQIHAVACHTQRPVIARPCVQAARSRVAACNCAVPSHSAYLAAVAVLMMHRECIGIRDRAGPCMRTDWLPARTATPKRRYYGYLALPQSLPVVSP